MSERLADTGGEILSHPSPKDDFYRYVNHEWLDSEEIPPTEAIWGSFNILRHRTYERLRGIAEAVQENQDAEKGSNVQQVRDFYRSGMDMETRNKLGVEPLNEQRSVIDAINDGDDAVSAIAALRLKGASTFFGSGMGEDDKKAGSNALFLYQAGLGLPNRDYYLKDDESNLEVQEKYKQYISKTFQMLGRTEQEADSAANTVYDIEHTLAQASYTEEDINDIDKSYFKFTLDEAREEFPGIDWGVYFKTLGKPDIKDFVVQQPDFFKKVGEVLQNTDIKDIKDYMEFRLLNGKGSGLSEEFATENFKFNGQVLSGMKEPQDLWKQTIEALHSTLLTDAIGPLYCEQYFNPEDKLKVMEMVTDVVDSFGERVIALDWMDQQTKELTLKKLDNITFKMGFPEKWLDVSSVDINPDTYLKNYMALAEYNFKRNLNRLDQPYDKTEWHMAPTLVNACSDLKREMTFPAAILQPPFYDSSQDNAYNYGAIGGVIGHELTHFFDDEGCKYDLEGNVKPWWSDQDKQKFEEKTEKFVEYFGSLEENGLKVNGQLTLGENLADVGGITIAYYALQKNLARNNSSEIVDGLTPEQRLFVGWGRVWARKIRPELAKQRILTDPHAPAEVRTNGVLAIVPEFQDAFDVTDGDKMFIPRDKQPTLW